MYKLNINMELNLNFLRTGSMGLVVNQKLYFGNIYDIHKSIY